MDAGMSLGAGCGEFMDARIVTRLRYPSARALVYLQGNIWGGRKMRRFWKLFIASGFAAGLCCGASAQTAAAEHGDTTSAAPVATTTAPSSPPATFAAKTLEIPAGTKVLLTIRSAINTKTAQAGDGVYLQSSFPVVANGRTVIPAGVYVQGVVDAVERHIRIKGPAKLTMHFTSIIFPNGTVVEIPGLVNSLPGSDGPKVKGDEGTVQQGSSVGDVAKAAGQGAAIGAGVGGISGGVNGHPVEGLGLGAAAGCGHGRDRAAIRC